jgi:hypothetical protein
MDAVMRKRIKTIIGILLLNFAGVSALAFGSYAVRDYTVEIAGHRYGFADYHPGWHSAEDNGALPFTLIELGPLGGRQIPLSAAQSWGLLLICLIAIMVSVVASARHADNGHSKHNKPFQRTRRTRSAAGR